MLKLAAAASFAIAILHLAIIFLGPEAYTWFGAPDLGALEAQGSRTPDLLTLVLVAVFAVFGLYALSGAGVFRRLTLLAVGLIAIGTIYTLRGLGVVTDLLQLTRGAAVPTRSSWIRQSAGRPVGGELLPWPWTGWLHRIHRAHQYPARPGEPKHVDPGFRGS